MFCLLTSSLQIVFYSKNWASEVTVFYNIGSKDASLSYWLGDLSTRPRAHRLSDSNCLNGETSFPCHRFSAATPLKCFIIASTISENSLWWWDIYVFTLQSELALHICRADWANKNLVSHSPVLYIERPFPLSYKSGNKKLLSIFISV